MGVRALEPGEAGRNIETDLVIIGSGPAGLSIARQFAGTKTQVLVLETGGLSEPPTREASEDYEIAGAPRNPDSRSVRNRVFGGSSLTWSGRCTTFDNIDFEARSWVPYSGWPITAADIESHIGRAGEILNLGPHIYDSRLWAYAQRPAPDKQLDRRLRTIFWQFSRPDDAPGEFMRFGPDFRKVDAPNIDVITNATVTHINTTPDGRKLVSLDVTHPDGRQTLVTPRAAILCAGGIENARLLLASNRIVPGGVGNANDTVGRFLMDHPRFMIAEFDDPAARAIAARLAYVQIREAGRNHFYTSGMALAEPLQREEKLLNCAAFMAEHRAADDPWDAINRLVRNRSAARLKDLAAVVSEPGLILRGAYQRLVEKRNVTHKLDKLQIDCLVEQIPDPESRLTLTARLDQFGVPIPRLDWKVGEPEKRSAMRLGQLFAEEIRRLGLPQPRLPDWVRDGRADQAPFRDMAHPIGTTRMSTDPKQGVVDGNSQVHGVEGLYITGSSVFPTASHANPTLMIVAMALRLADHVKDNALA